MQDLESELFDDIAGFAFDPLGHARYVYDWGHGVLSKHKDLRKWQAKELQLLGDHLRNPETRHTPYRVAVASGHGIGKSALIGMILKWGMDTCVDTRAIVTANTDGQLKSKTMPEVKKWFNLAINSDWFDVTATKISSSDKSEGNDHADSWRCDFIPWSERNPDAFAGLHNAGKRIIIIFDEASGIHEKIWEAVEGAGTDADTEIIWIAFGNPIRNKGRFRDCWRKFSRMWTTRNIDSREVEGTNKELFNQWSDTYGEDSDFMRARVKGQFPNASAMQFFPSSMVEASQKIELSHSQISFAPSIITCDPAWTGNDDLVISHRKGLFFEVLKVIPMNDNDIEIAQLIFNYEKQFDAQAVFVDGGYGTGIISAGKTMGRNWTIVWFSGKSSREDCGNKRDEMIVGIRDWLKEGGSIPADDQELHDELIAVESMGDFEGKYRFPPKSAMSEELGRSPGRLDSLGLSFAYPVSNNVNWKTPKVNAPKRGARR